MKKFSVAIVDYGVGNHESVRRAFSSLGYRSHISSDPERLSEDDVLVLPGVGAFPVAMAALHSLGLVDFLRESARVGRPIIGLCLGMQLLADESLEHGVTAGLSLIPGRVVPLEGTRWHIGWNSIEVVGDDALLMPSDGEAMYFNHSFAFEAPGEYRACLARLNRPVVAGVRRGKVVGLQFHPEKSQTAGRIMLRNLVEGLAGA